MQKPVLVIGATGKVGRWVVTGLTEAGVPVRALVRDPGSAALPGTVDVRGGDLTDAATVAAAVEGVGAVFLLWPGFSSDGAVPVVEAIARSGAHVAYLSAAELQQDGPVPIGVAKAGVWQQIEQLIDARAPSRTFLRAGGFAGNTLAWAGAIRSGQPVRIPYPQAGRSLVHERDLADVAVAALLDSRQRREEFALTGPQILTQAEQAGIIADVTSQPFPWEEQEPAEALAELSSFMGEEVARSSLGYWASLVDRPEQVTGDVERMTGHPARTFAQWAQGHAADFQAGSVQETS